MSTITLTADRNAVETVIGLARAHAEYLDELAEESKGDADEGELRALEADAAWAAVRHIENLQLVPADDMPLLPASTILAGARLAAALEDAPKNDPAPDADDDDGYPPRCSDPAGHRCVTSEETGRCYCENCLADGDA
jgi:hypothetical protein